MTQYIITRVELKMVRMMMIVMMVMMMMMLMMMMVFLVTREVADRKVLTFRLPTTAIPF